MEEVKDNVTPIHQPLELFPKKLRSDMESNLKPHGKNTELMVTVVEQTICAFVVALVGMAATIVAEKLASKIAGKFSKD